MITEADLTHDALYYWLLQTYHLATQQMTFLPQGKCAWVYHIKANNEDFILKLWRPGLCRTPYSVQGIQTVQALYYDFGITQMTPPPLRGTTGLYVNSLAPYEAVLLKYMEGVSAEDADLTEIQQRQLGALLGRIHRSKLHTRERPDQEDYGAEVPDIIERILAEANKPTRRYAPFHFKVLDAIQRVQTQIRERLTSFVDQRRMLWHDTGLRADSVVCHGNPKLDNLILTPDDSITLIDWDHPVFAPRERDLYAIQQWPAMMESYQSLVGEVTLRPQILRFYELWDELGGLADFGRRVLFQRQDNRQNKHDVLKLIDILKGFAQE
jgi:spectinomycin phosphotransferase